jgi:hypothetical protein
LLDDARDPFAVEILADHHDNAAPAKKICRGQHAAVPERHDRTPSAAFELQVLEPLDFPIQRRAERGDQRHTECGYGRSLRPFDS